MKIKLIKQEMRGRYLRTHGSAVHGYDYTLERRWGLRVIGILVWVWWEKIRDVPVWEWARCAAGECISDEPENPRV